jgi:regulator of RNase E activity RraA
VGQTIVERSSNGNIYGADFVGSIFYGTATAAKYADLAEKYLPDQEYDVGTVLVIGGEKEVTASSWGKRAIGVVSENPAYMMNKDLEGGTYVALKGRVPVKVIGSIKKGDNLIASNNGYAVAAVHHSTEVFAISLETNSDTGVKLVEALVL